MVSARMKARASVIQLFRMASRFISSMATNIIEQAARSSPIMPPGAVGERQAMFQGRFRGYGGRVADRCETKPFRPNRSESSLSSPASATNCVRNTPSATGDRQMLP